MDGGLAFPYFVFAMPFFFIYKEILFVGVGSGLRTVVMNINEHTRWLTSKRMMDSFSGAV